MITVEDPIPADPPQVQPQRPLARLPTGEKSVRLHLVSALRRAGRGFERLFLGQA